MRSSALMALFCSGLLLGCGGKADKQAAGKPTKKTSKTSQTKSSPAKGSAIPSANVTNIDAVDYGALSEPEVVDGWINLFDGKSLYGWTPNSDANWRVEDGTVVCDGDEKGLLQTNFQFANYEFKCEFKLEKGGNSGVFLRSQFSPKNPAEDCYELNMCDTHKAFKTGSLVGRVTADKDIPIEDDQWHAWHVKCVGNEVNVLLDDQLVLGLKDQTVHVRSTGHIGLQMNEGRVAFRKIVLKPLSTRELLDGKSLDGWNEVPGGKSDFKLVDGLLTVTNGAGFLETAEEFDNFLLQVDVKTNGTALNSGVFFRAMKGTEKAPSHGYEMQIQNGVLDGDPTKPADSGTGAIFRRQAARVVNGRDMEQTVCTLIAQGNHIGSWVNGMQVVDWKDEREPDENPRKGQRLKAGHISLQGHDPTTDLQFRSIRIAPAPMESLEPANTEP